MLELSLKEQKQINGGRIKITCVAYDTVLDTIDATLETYSSSQARNFETVWKDSRHKVTFHFTRE